MKKRKIIATGLAGTGVMAMGELLAYGSMDEDKNIIWLPNYGKKSPNMAKFCLIYSQSEGENCLETDLSDLIIISGDVSEKLVEKLEKGGNLFINETVIDYIPKRDDINIYKIPATELARKLGYQKTSHMIMLGAFLEVTEALNFGTVVKAFTKVFGYDLKDLLPIYQKAVVTGAGAVRSSSAKEKHIERQSNAEVKTNKYNKEKFEFEELSEDFKDSIDSETFKDDLSIAEHALENEIIMVRFYNKSKEILRGNITSEVFGSLAKQSDEHLLYLKGLIKKLKGQSIYIDEVDKTSIEEEKINWKEFSDEKRIMALSIFEEAIKLKNNSIEFYKKASEKAKKDFAKRLYDELKYWENYQLQQLEGQYQILKEENEESI